MTRTKTTRRLWRDRLSADLKKPGFKEEFQTARAEARVAASIAVARERAHLTQSQLAARLGMSQPAVARIEGGAQNLTVDSLARIAQALKRTLVIELR